MKRGIVILASLALITNVVAAQSVVAITNVTVIPMTAAAPAPRQTADLVLLDANPLEDIRHTRRVSAVVLRGPLMRRMDLDHLLADVRAMPDIRVNDWLR